MTGTLAFARSDPVTETTPRMRRSGISALALTDTAPAAEVRGCQVPLHRPSPNRVSASGGSPFENVAITDPLVIGAPQSSMTRTSTGEGQPPGARKSLERLVNTGTSAVGAQPSAACTADLDPAEGTVRRTTLTLRIFPSANRSVSASRLTPGARPLLCG